MTGRRKSTAVHEALAQSKLLQSQGKFLEAIAELDRATLLNKELNQNVQLQNTRGLNHFKAGLYEEALQDFERAEALDGMSASTVYNKGNALVKLGRDHDALKAFTRATELAPKLVEGHAAAARTLQKMNKPTRALASVNRALEIDPHHVSANEVRVRALSKLGRFLDAVDSVRILIKANNKNPGIVALGPMARVLVLAADKLPLSDERAVNFLREACALSPSYVTFDALAYRLSAKGLHEEAAHVYRRAAEHDPSQYRAPLMEGACYVQLEDYHHALPALRRSLKLSGEDPEVRFLLGLTLVHLEKYDEAEEPLLAVTRAVGPAFEEMGSKALFLLASSYLHANKMERALDVLQKARKRPSATADIHFQAGYTANLQDRPELARECFAACLALDPDHARAREMLAQLDDEMRPPSPPPLPAPPESSPPASKPPPPPPPSPPQSATRHRFFPSRIAGAAALSPPSPLHSKALLRSHHSAPEPPHEPGSPLMRAARARNESASAADENPPKLRQVTFSPSVPGHDRKGPPFSSRVASSSSSSSSAGAASASPPPPLGANRPARATHPLPSVPASAAAAPVAAPAIAPAAADEGATSPQDKPRVLGARRSSDQSMRPSSALRLQAMGVVSGATARKLVSVGATADEDEASLAAKQAALFKQTAAVAPQPPPAQEPAAVPTTPAADHEEPVMKEEELTDESSLLDVIDAGVVEAPAMPAAAAAAAAAAEPPRQLGPRRPSAGPPPAIPARRPDLARLRTKASSSPASVPSPSQSATPPTPPPPQAPLQPPKTPPQPPSTVAAAPPRESSSTSDSQLPAVEQVAPDAPASAVSAEVLRMLNELFGPPAGTLQVVDHLEKVFANEGLERMDDVAALSADELAKVGGMRPAWARRIARHVHAAPSSSSASSAAAAAATTQGKPANGNAATSSPRRASHRFLEGVETFNRGMLHTAAAGAAAAEPKRAPANPLLDNIKNFRRDSLKRASLEMALEGGRKPLAPDGFLGALLGAMRSRRVLIDDVDFDNEDGGGAPRTGAMAARRSATHMSGDGDLLEDEWG